MSAAGVLLSAGSALAAGSQSSTDVVGNLGMFSTLAGTIMTYSKYVAFFMAIISLLALVGQTKADVRDTMIEVGDSSILKVAPPWFRPVYESSKRRLIFPNGSICVTIQPG